MRTTRVRISPFLLSLVAGFAAAIILSVQPAYACSCAGTPTPEQALEGSDAVFVGEVVATGLPDPDPKDGVEVGGARFAVERSWKGVPGGLAVVYGQGEVYFGPPEEGEIMMENSCGVRFAKNTSYLVYADRDDDGYLSANVCSGTTNLAEADEDLDELGPPFFPMPRTGGVTIPAWGALSVAAVALLLLSGLLARRFGRG